MHQSVSQSIQKGAPSPTSVENIFPWSEFRIQTFDFKSIMRPSFSRGSYTAIKLPWAYIPYVFMHQMALGKEGDSQVERMEDFECESPRRIMGRYCPPRGHPHLPWCWDKPLLWVLTLGQASSPCWPTRMYSVSSFSRLKMPRTDTP